MVQSFDCGDTTTMFCNKAADKNVSIIPGRETPSGITHAYKEGSFWKFIAQEDYEAKKAELPDLAFAFTYPCSSFETKALTLPDLNELISKIGIAEEAKTHSEVSKLSLEEVHADEPLYCSVSKISGKE
mmetsp:Transcript_18316/g.24459  ORF Transcript_18316/g.24459 Transcript_18316/m.24459 type:complete len:129 (-) Transcript_18316:2116-2502(-)